MTKVTHSKVAVDTQAGHFYVSVTKPGTQDYRLLLGPFAEHQAALDQVQAVTQAACKMDPKAHWYAFGTCRLPLEDQAPAGILNSHMAAM